MESKVQRFSLTLLGEARLWYQSLEPINVNWQGLQNLFRQQYSKIGKTREQLFHAWRSFNFNENTEKIDAYVTYIRQVAALLGYGEPHILEVFKNTLPKKLYWILFPIEDLRQAVETAKRILTKEKVDKQLAGQSSSTPFMSIRDGHHRKVSVDTRKDLGKKIDKLAVMIGKLATKEADQIGNINHKSIRIEVEVRTGIMIRETIKISTVKITDQIVETEDSTDRIEICLDMNQDTNRVIKR